MRQDAFAAVIQEKGELGGLCCKVVDLMNEATAACQSLNQYD